MDRCPAALLLLPPLPVLEEPLLFALLPALQLAVLLLHQAHCCCHGLAAMWLRTGELGELYARAAQLAAASPSGLHTMCLPN